MARLLAVVGVGALAIATVALGSAIPAPERAASTAELIAKLGSARFADREAAGRALEALGPSAIPALEAAVRSGNPEISRRAGAIVARLRRQADSTHLLAPTKVRLAYRDIPLGTAVNDLKARTGINLVLDPALVADPLRPVTIESGELPAWEAVEVFCQAAGLREVFLAELPVPKGPTEQRRGYYTPPPPPPAADAVPITLADGKYQAIPGSRSTSVRVLALPRSFPGHRVFLGTGDVVLSFDVSPAPGLNWQDLSGVRITKLIDDAGRFGTGGSLKKQEVSPYDPFGGGIMMGGGVGGRIVVMRWDLEGNPVLPTEHPNPRVVPVPLKVATPSARSIRLLEGVVVGEILVADQEIAVIDRPAEKSGATVAGVGGNSVIVGEVSRNGTAGATFLVQIRSESPQQRAQMLGLWGGPMWPVRGPGATGATIKGLDDRGQPLAATANPTTGISDDGTTRTMQLSVTFPDAVPAKLVIVGPAAVPVEVPFRMENVPLP